MASRALTARRPQRGAALVQSVLILFGLMGLAAVIVDIRIALVTQQGMQAATDAAALEGLRYRDFANDGFRRNRARNRVEFTYDDDLNTANGDELRLGAGPVFGLTGGDTSLNANALIDISGPTVYDPEPQLNFPNAAQGDFVAGEFDEGDDLHHEFSTYARSDFTPSPAGASQSAEAFLARLRRSSGVLDNQAGVSSSGPTIPYLFGLACSITQAGGGASNPRRDGMTVRATSIAAARRALRIAGPGPGFNFQALQRFGLRADAAGILWDSLAVDDVIEPTVEADGRLMIAGVLWGEFVAPNSISLTDPIVDYVGEPTRRILPEPIVFAPPAGIFPTDRESFVPLIRNIDGVDRAIAFGRVRVEEGTTPDTILVTKLAAAVVPVGATAVHQPALATLATNPTLLSAHATVSEPVLAPVLVR